MKKIQFLLDNPNIQIDYVPKIRLTALNCAIENGRDDVVKILIDKGVSLEDISQKCPFKACCLIKNKQKAKQIVKILLTAGCKVNLYTKDIYGMDLIFYMTTFFKGNLF